MLDVFIDKLRATTFILVYEPKEQGYKFKPKSKRLLHFFSICHGSDINCEDGKNSFVAVEVNSEKSDYGWCNLDVWQ